MTVSQHPSYGERAVSSHRIHPQLKADVLFEPEARVHLSGELDLGSIGILENALAEIEALENQTIVVDLSGLTFIDLAGLSRILDARSRLARHGRQLEVAHLSPAVTRLLDILDRVGCSVELAQGA